MSLDELRTLLERHARPGLTTAIDGVRVCKADHAVPPVSSMSGTVLAVIAQGGKRLALGDRVYEYGAGQYLVASVDLPVTGHFVDTASPSLGFGMTLEPAVIAELLLRTGPGEQPRSTGAAPPGIAVSDAPDELLDAVVRLLRLLDRPGDRKALVPLVKREILWRLMTGEQGDAVRQLGLADSSLSHIERAVRWIRENYTQPFRVEELARLSGMSVSAFHRNFQMVTTMSPIQFQKQMRLQAARLLLANSPNDVTGVGRHVGYDNPSQFSREYRRQFGAPPSVDAVRLRGGAGPAAVALP
ncbi:AraC family transcriptional regulator [Microbispora bryophytorum]|uniref:AraC family transcriptional regulator n=1 Tax=Microbispora bryophytorum TaxID=1460882 RepID=A0A8H9H1S0_9ACTN|nr:AraC family transcriptional regulator [Microbispora bryophytorum]MBD3135063.1 AraC family transcriptional regulator [Microbispora bryophytorum]TQS08706.1 AraC family transcriptional regulator [Microbispora bryophytorum]GGO10842.1 AraC family transcriptional regulator [Microbispora bryophytorum]